MRTPSNHHFQMPLADPISLSFAYISNWCHAPAVTLVDVFMFCGRYTPPESALRYARSRFHELMGMLLEPFPRMRLHICAASDPVLLTPTPQYPKIFTPTICVSKSAVGILNCVDS